MKNLEQDQNSAIFKSSINENNQCRQCGKTLKEQAKGCTMVSCYRQYLSKEKSPDDFVRNPNPVSEGEQKLSLEEWREHTKKEMLLTKEESIVEAASDFLINRQKEKEPEPKSKDWEIESLATHEWVGLTFSDLDIQSFLNKHPSTLNWTINSVKRPSDNELLFVGRKDLHIYAYFVDTPCEILSFKIVGKEMYCNVKLIDGIKFLVYISVLGVTKPALPPDEAKKFVHAVDIVKSAEKARAERIDNLIHAIRVYLDEVNELMKKS